MLYNRLFTHVPKVVAIVFRQVLMQWIILRRYQFFAQVRPKTLTATYQKRILEIL